MKTMTIQLRDEGSSESVVTFETGKHYPDNGFRILATRGKLRKSDHRERPDRTIVNTEIGPS